VGLAVSLLLVAAGGILAWGVTSEPSGLNLDAIGAILIVIGIVGFVLSLILWRSWWGPGYFSRSTYVDDGPEGPAPGRWSRRRTTYVENEPPPGPPPP
jgi:hypothetical protein